MRALDKKATLAPLIALRINQICGILYLSTTNNNGDDMKLYTISNAISGQDLGTYVAECTWDALDAMARDAGYAGWEAACAVTGECPSARHLIVALAADSAAIHFDADNTL